MNALLEKIKSRGHWQTVIRPMKFVGKRIRDIRALYPILEKTSVHLRGWDFPHLDRHANLHIDVDWIGQESEWEHHLEVWRFYQSGQFMDIAGIPHDWRDQSGFWPADEKGGPGRRMSVGDALFRFTEIFEFAARLSLTEAGDDQMNVRITLVGLQDRSLVVEDPRRAPLFADYKASLDEFPYEVELARTDLAADPREFALKAAIELFLRFGWEAREDVLREYQAELRR